MDHYLFDWGDTLMVNLPGQTGPMCDWPEVRRVRNARPALRELSRAARCHLATNAMDSDSTQIRRALARAGLDAWIDRVYCFRDLGFAKPSREYFESIVEDLGIGASRLTMVGDDLEKDVRGALRCDLRAVWYNCLGRETPAGIVSISDLGELPRLAALRSSAADG